MRQRRGARGAQREPLNYIVNLHLGPEMHSFIVADLGTTTTITRNLRLESAHFQTPICFLHNKSAAPQGSWPGLKLQ